MEKTLNAGTVDTKGWFKYWFDSAFYHKLYSHRNLEEAAAFIDKLLEHLQPAPYSRMLDLGCGNGRHSRYLASRGFDVTGMDLAASSIQEASRFRSSTLRFLRHDMRVPFGKDSFDYLFSFFTSFGYFDDVSADHNVLDNISNALKQGGTLVMDYINFECAERRLVANEQKEVDGIVYHIERWSDEKHIFKKIVIENTGRGEPVKFIERIRKFSLDDFTNLLSSYGLQVQEVYGDYHMNGYEKLESPRLIIIAKKNSGGHKQCCKRSSISSPACR